MPKVNVYNQLGEVVGDIELNEAIFGIEVNEHVVYEVVKNQLANRRQGTQSAKTRAEVRGGGKKPWRQKGTGRARQGSIRAPQWKGGGVVFAPKPRDYSYAVPKKVRRLAMKSVLTSKVIEGELKILDALTIDTFSTKKAKEVLKNLNVESKTIVVLEKGDQKIVKSFANLPKVETVVVDLMNVYDLMRFDNLVILKDALTKIMITAYDIIIKPVVTESSMEAMEQKRYTFKVDPKANKSEIKKAIETIFGVKVKKVNTMNITGKKKRMGANVGKRSDWKKAIVTLTEDSKEIEFFEGI